MAKIDLYHGSSRILEHPYLGGGRANNDYGPGLYCTLIPDLAKEWACSEKSGGFANHYRLETEGLRTLELNSEDYHILNWLAILLENWTYDLTNPLAIQAKKYILEHFLPRYHSYDLITGNRADDSYSSFSRAFLSNTISMVTRLLLQKTFHWSSCAARCGWGNSENSLSCAVGRPSAG